MLTVNISGNSIQEIAREAREFANLVLGESSGETGNADTSWDGYRPSGVGRPEMKYAPIDDGRDWNEEAIKDWLGRIKDDGRDVVRILAKKLVIDPREEAEKLGWTGPTWAGVWTGPRRQAGYVLEAHGLRSWPYGHTYDEPRKMWMHEDIAARVLKILGNKE